MRLPVWPLHVPVRTRFEKLAIWSRTEWTSGTNRPENALMEAVPGLLLKSGAEGVVAFALPDGHAAAVKVADGAARALPALAVALLRRLGADTADGADGAALDQIATVPVLGGGRAVGHIRAMLPP